MKKSNGGGRVAAGEAVPSAEANDRDFAFEGYAESGEQFPAAVNTDTGTFEVSGPDGKGIKPGRYKVAVTAGVGVGDYFGDKYAPDKTQVVRDVKPGEEVVIDLSKPQG